MNRFVAVSLIALAMSVVGVGVVWASSGALRANDPLASTVDSTVPDGDQTGDDPDAPIDVPGIDPDADIAELRRMVLELTSLVEEMGDIVATVREDMEGLDQRTIDALEAAERASSLASEAADDAATVKSTADEAKRIADGAAADVSSVVARTSQLDENGVYTGRVNPNQLSRKLTPTDLSGDWPLTRVTGDLKADHLMVNSFGCSSKFGFNTVLSVDAFRRVTCVYVAK